MSLGATNFNFFGHLEDELCVESVEVFVLVLLHELPELVVMADNEADGWREGGRQFKAQLFQGSHRCGQLARRISKERDAGLWIQGLRFYSILVLVGVFKRLNDLLDYLTHVSVLVHLLWHAWQASLC